MSHVRPWLLPLAAASLLACTPEEPPFQPEALPFTTPGELGDVRVAPGGAFLALGFPPSIVSTTDRSGVVVDDARPPAGWVEGYLVEGHAQRWHADGTLVDDGAATALAQSSSLLGITRDDGFDLIAKVDGAVLLHTAVPAVVEVVDDVAVVEADGQLQVWTGAHDLTVLGTGQLAEQSSSAILLVRGGGAAFVDRATGALTAVSFAAHLLPDGGYVDLDGDNVVAFDVAGGAPRVVCSGAPVLLSQTAARCGDNVFDLDGNLVEAVPAGASFAFSPTGRGWVEGTFSADNISQGLRFRFADGAHVARPPRILARRPTALWSPDENGAVVAGSNLVNGGFAGPPSFFAVRSDGTERELAQQQTLTDFFFDEDVFFAVGDAVDAIPFRTMSRLAVSETAPVSRFFMSSGRLVLIDAEGLAVENPIGSRRGRLLAATLVDLLRPTADVVVVDDGDRLTAVRLPPPR